MIFYQLTKFYFILKLVFPPLILFPKVIVSYNKPLVYLLRLFIFVKCLLNNFTPTSAFDVKQVSTIRNFLFVYFASSITFSKIYSILFLIFGLLNPTQTVLSILPIKTAIFLSIIYLLRISNIFQIWTKQQI